MTTPRIRFWHGLMYWREDFCIGVWFRQWFFDRQSYRYVYRAGVKLGIYHFSVQWQSPFRRRRQTKDRQP